MEVDLILEILDPLTLDVMIEEGQGDDPRNQVAPVIVQDSLQVLFVFRVQDVLEVSGGELQDVVMLCHRGRNAQCLHECGAVDRPQALSSVRLGLRVTSRPSSR
jgi:hypothetical protein